MEHKQFAAYTGAIDEPQGIVEKIVAVMGNIDQGNDRIWNGAFSKTVQERGLKIKALDQHNSGSVRNVVGKTLAMRELNRDELPAELLMRYPDATGGLWVKTQYILDTQAGRETFALIKAGAVDECSIGYDPIIVDYATVETSEGRKTVRNLRECKLWEYSDVVFGMNSATGILSAKEQPDTAPAEGKPYRAIHDTESGKWKVFKLDEDGKPTGRALGTHDTEEEAQAQVRALYAAEPNAADQPRRQRQPRGTTQPAGSGVAYGVVLGPPEGASADGASTEKADGEEVTRSEADGDHPADHYLVTENVHKPSTWHLRVLGADGKPDHRLMGAAWASLHAGYRGNVYEGPGKDEAIRKLRALYESEEMTVPGKALSLDEQSRIVREAWRARFDPPVDAGLVAYTPSNRWPRDVYSDLVIVEAPDGLWAYPYTSQEDGIVFGEPVKVEVAFMPAAKQANLADWLESSIHQAFTNLADGLLQGGAVTREERIGLSGLIGDALDTFHQGLQGEAFAAMCTRRPGEEVKALKAGRRVRLDRLERARAACKELQEFLAWADYEDEDGDELAPPVETPGAARSDTDQQNKAAGPDCPPTAHFAALVKTLEMNLSQLEVEQ